jgi:hypothetical protein
MHSFSISKFELVWIIWKNIKTAGATHQPAGLNHSTTRVDRVRTVATTLPPTVFSAHRFRRLNDDLVRL